MLIKYIHKSVQSSITLQSKSSFINAKLISRTALDIQFNHLSMCDSVYLKHSKNLICGDLIKSEITVLMS